MTRDDITSLKLHRHWISHVVGRLQGATMPFCASRGRPYRLHDPRPPRLSS